MNKQGVYVIICQVNKMVYVGGSAKVKKRWAVHVALLNRCEHFNEQLQRDWMQYGQGKFKFRRIKDTDVEDYKQKEKFFISMLESKGFRLYNTRMTRKNNSPTI